METLKITFLRDYVSPSNVYYPAGNAEIPLNKLQDITDAIYKGIAKFTALGNRDSRLLMLWLSIYNRYKENQDNQKAIQDQNKEITKAKDDAAAAKTASEAAKTAATNAQNSATAASTSAQTSASESAAAKTAAQNSATSATSAQNSANASVTSANAAQISATNAQTSSAASATSANNAATSAQNSQTAANASAASSATSATAAQNSANSSSAAATSAANANTIVNNFVSKVRNSKGSGSVNLSNLLGSGVRTVICTFDTAFDSTNYMVTSVNLYAGLTILSNIVVSNPEKVKTKTTVEVELTNKSLVSLTGTINVTVFAILLGQ